jgi:hypothetical protein
MNLCITTLAQVGTGSRSTGNRQEAEIYAPAEDGSRKGLLAGICFTLIRRGMLALGAALPCHNLAFCVEIVLMLL